jgi:hypothetical protein
MGGGYVHAWCTRDRRASNAAVGHRLSGGTFSGGEGFEPSNDVTAVIVHST